MKSSEPFLEVARAHVERVVGSDLGRGGVARALERYVERRVRELSLRSAAELALRLDEDALERERLVEAVTVTHSWLFRDRAQLDAIGALVSAWPRGRLRVWVAGCAGGEDAYTLAALLLRGGHDPQILATDVNASAMARAREGRYSAWAARELPSSYRTFFEQDGEGVVASRELRERVRVARHSLVDPPPMPEGAPGWDLVVCRNVLIYFARPRMLEMADRLGRSLREEGLLALGASDVLAELPAGLTTSGGGRLVLIRREQVASAAPRPEARLEPPRMAAPAPVRALEASPVGLEPPIAPEPPCTLALISAGDVETALLRAQARVAEEPTDPGAHFALGLCHYARADWTAAIERLRAAACLAPSAWPVLFYLGLAHERAGNWPEARRAYLRAMKSPDEDIQGVVTGTSELARMLVGRRAELMELATRRALALGH